MELTKLVSPMLDSNTFIVRDGGEALIIDAGADLSAIQSVVTERVKAILLTHGHYDHAFHALEIAKFYDCQIYASVHVKDILPDSKKNYGNDFAINDFSRFVFFDGDITLKIGHFRVEVIALPGHSRCSVGYIIGGTLFAGDTLFARGIGRTDLFGGSKSEMLSSLKKIQTLSFTSVASGHGDDSTSASQKRNLETFIKFLSR